MSGKKETCEWPGCSNEALCSSGNVGGALVCSEHFAITNGKEAGELTPHELACMEKMVPRKGDWFVTYSGKQFWPLDPKPEDICIHDIAHHLSLICRFGGAVRQHYSVAQHSLVVADILPRPLKLRGLLHDATEAYVGDMVRPLKRFMDDYRSVESFVWAAIRAKFNLPLSTQEEDEAIKTADNVALVTERRDLLLSFPYAWCVKEAPLPQVITPLSAREAEIKFLETFYELSV
ncbi:MAG: phosphohydrolase [Patescibacteria group bacterium]|nr:phosphohydrolase [Patescibacteria group bacterium]